MVEIEKRREQTPLVTLRARLDRALEDFFVGEQWSARSKLLPDWVGNALSEFVLSGGKRSRPMLLLATWLHLSGGNQPDSNVMDAAVAMELVHSFMLIHDDVIDDSDLRRGRDTLRKALRTGQGDGTSDAGRRADHLAIVLGDVCFALALELLGGTGHDRTIRSALVAEMLKHSADTGVGQVLDVLGTGGERTLDFDAEAIRVCYDLKTARYSIECPMVLAAILAESSPETRAALRQIARKLGVAYQLNDDLAGIEFEVGTKPAALDFEQGRATALLATTVGLCKRDDRQWLAERFGHGPMARADRQRLLCIYRDSGAIDAIRTEIGLLQKEALVLVDAVEGRSEEWATVLAAIAGMQGTKRTSGEPSK